MMATVFTGVSPDRDWVTWIFSAGGYLARSLWSSDYHDGRGEVNS